MSGNKPSRVTKALAGVGLAATLLSACRDSEPETQPPTSAATSPETTASSSPTPTEPTPPVLPAAASGRSDAAVKAFVDYWVDTVNYAMTTGDTRPLEASSSDCGGCDDYVDLYRGIYSSGGFLKTTGWTPTFKQVDSGAGGATVLLEVRAAPVRYRIEQGADTQQSDSNVYQLRLQTKRGASGWVVTSLDNA